MKLYIRDNRNGIKQRMDLETIFNQGFNSLGNLNWAFDSDNDIEDLEDLLNVLMAEDYDVAIDSTFEDYLFMDKGSDIFEYVDSELHKRFN